MRISWDNRSKRKS